MGHRAVMMRFEPKTGHRQHMRSRTFKSYRLAWDFCDYDWRNSMPKGRRFLKRDYRRFVRQDAQCFIDEALDAMYQNDAPESVSAGYNFAHWSYWDDFWKDVQDDTDLWPDEALRQLVDDFNPADELEIGDTWSDPAEIDWDLVWSREAA